MDDTLTFTSPLISLVVYSTPLGCFIKWHVTITNEASERWTYRCWWVTRGAWTTVATRCIDGIFRLQCVCAVNPTASSQCLQATLVVRRIERGTAQVSCTGNRRHGRRRWQTVGLGVVKAAAWPQHLQSLHVVVHVWVALVRLYTCTALHCKHSEWVSADLRVLLCSIFHTQLGPSD